MASVRHDATDQPRPEGATWPGESGAGCPAEACDRCDYRPLFDELRAPLVWLRQSVIVDVNDAICDWLGHSAEQLIGTPLHRIIPAAERRNAYSPWHAIAGCKTLVNAELGVLDAAGITREAIASTFGKSAASPEGRLLLLRPAQHAEAFAADLAQQSALAYELTAAEARERRRIANGLHDEIGQVLAIIGLKLAALGTASSHDDVAGQVGELLSFVAQAQQATRSATFELSCPVLQHMGLQAAIEGLAERLSGVADLSIHVQGTIPAAPMPEPVGQIVFRIVRELLMNAIKHSRAHHAWIGMAQHGDELRFTVQDDGIGMPPLPPRPGREGGYGLHNIEAQIQAIGGRLALASMATGTRVEISVPMSRAVASAQVS